MQKTYNCILTAHVATSLIVGYHTVITHNRMVIYSSTCRRSFTDFAFVDFEEQRKDWKTNSILTAKQYAQVLGRRPQSLNDYKYSCARLQQRNKLHNMTFEACEQRRLQFANSMKTIR